MSELRAAIAGRDLAHDGWPTVSVVLPIRDEAADLERAVTAILAQDYPVPFDVCLAVAPSSDDTEAIASRITEREPRVAVVPNPSGATPAVGSVADRWHCLCVSRPTIAASRHFVPRSTGFGAVRTGWVKRVRITNNSKGGCSDP